MPTQGCCTLSWRPALPAFLLAAIVVAGAGPARAVGFDPLQTLESGLGSVSVIAMGPEDPVPGSPADGCVYAGNAFSGEVRRICFDAAKSVTSSTVAVDLNGPSGVSTLLGIAFDPASDPSGEIVLYLAFAVSNSAPFNGRIARAVSIDGGSSYSVDESFITGLPRSSFDHQTNGLAFGPDGCMYIAQGNNSNAGYDVGHAESHLSSAVLRACFRDAAGGVNPAFDRDCGTGNTQQACDLELFASGLRNPYDLVWHSNGRLYVTDNDAALGYRDSCVNVANEFGCPCQSLAVDPIGDELNLVERGFYYGSPNPYRANPSSKQCQGGTDGTDECVLAGDCGGGGACEDLSALCVEPICGEDVQCYYFGDGEPPLPGEDPGGLYREPISQIPALLDGVAEYAARSFRRGAFCSDWQGDLIVTGGPGPLRRFALTEDGRSASHAGTAQLRNAEGLDVALGADGTIYSADFDLGRVSYIEPVAQPDPVLPDFFRHCDTSTEFGAWDAPLPPAALPAPRTGLSAAALELAGAPYVFVFGQQSSSEVLRYDVAADAWSSSSDPGAPGAPPAPPHPLSGPPTSGSKAAVAVGSTVYVFGGLAPFTADAWAYDGVSETTAGRLSRIGCNGSTQDCSGADHTGTIVNGGLRVGAIAAAAIGDEIYVAGGLCNTTGAGSANCTCDGVVGGTGGNCTGNAAPGSNTDRALRYSIGTDDWSEIAPLPVAVSHAAGAAVRGRFYVIGGRQCGSDTPCEGRTEVQVYDPGTDSWSLGTPMPEGCSATGAAAVLNGRLYVVGGEGGACTGTKVQEYDPAGDSWRLVTSLPGAHSGIWPVAVGDPEDGEPDRVFVSGGAPSPSHHHAFAFGCEECGAAAAVSSCGPGAGRDDDVDGICALQDCDDDDPLGWARPGGVAALGFADASTLVWQAPASPGGVDVVYDAVRSGDPADFVNGASCVETADGSDTTASVPASPSPGTADFFLVRAVSGCPAGEGSLGRSSAGVERNGRSCP